VPTLHVPKDPRLCVTACAQLPFRYHSRTKNQWARDDPAFVVVLAYLLLVASLGWSVAFNRYSLFAVLRLAMYVITVDFLAIGAVMATIGSWLSNHYLHEKAAWHSWQEEGSGRLRETVEWQYAFDIHCNAFVPLFLLLYVLQYLLLPVLLRPGALPALLSNTLYALALGLYHFVTFLGYNELPFLRSSQYFIYPIGLVAAAFVLSLPFVWHSGFSCTWLVVGLYFGDDW